MTTKEEQRQRQHRFRGEMRVRINRRIHPNATAETVKELVDRTIQGEKIEGVEVILFRRGYGSGKLYDKTEALKTGQWVSDTVGGFITTATKRSVDTNTENRKGKRRNQ